MLIEKNDNNYRFVENHEILNGTPICRKKKSCIARPTIMYKMKSPCILKTIQYPMHLLSLVSPITETRLHLWSHVELQQNCGVSICLDKCYKGPDSFHHIFNWFCSIHKTRDKTSTHLGSACDTFLFLFYQAFPLLRFCLKLRSTLSYTKEMKCNH